MFWDKAAGVYDFVMSLKNGRGNRRICIAVSEMICETDVVLECACGTGMISKHLAKKCKHLTATDFSEKMLEKTKKKCRRFSNISVEAGNILELKYKSESFDRVVAGNVIHLLDEPGKAISELLRVCKPGGTVIIPTYINNEKNGKPSKFVTAISKAGADVKQDFSYETYKEFIRSFCENATFMKIEGQMPCGIAIIEKK